MATYKKTIRNALMLNMLLSIAGCTFSPKYKIKGHEVYLESPNFKDLVYQKSISKLENVHAESFKILIDGCYAKDDQTVYYQQKPVPQADPHTFEALGELLGRDQKYGFFAGKELVNSDGRTFKKVTDVYALDKARVYYTDEMITGADPKSFEIVDPETGVSKDHNAYYKYETKLPVQDQKTFTRLGGEFWKDKYHVYYIYNPADPGRIVLKGVDPASARVVNNATIKDKYGCHNGYERVNCNGQ